ncbi:hypothetical protein ACET3Z_028685 [Daucus carota]
MATKDPSPTDVLPGQTWEQRSHHFYGIYKKENGNYNQRINCEVLPTLGTKLRLMLYIHDHMRKNNMHEAAKIFAEEANLELDLGTMLQNISPRFTSISTMSPQLVGNTSHCKGKDSVMEPSPSVFVPTPGIDRPWFENSMPNVSGTSHQQHQASAQSSLLVSGVASNQNSQGRSSSQMQPTLQVPGPNSPSTGSRNPSAGAFDFFKYYFRD